MTQINVIENLVSDHSRIHTNQFSELFLQRAPTVYPWYLPIEGHKITHWWRIISSHEHKGSKWTKVWTKEEKSFSIEKKYYTPPYSQIQEIIYSLNEWRKPL